VILKAIQFVLVWAMRDAVYIIALALIALSLPARADLPEYPVFTITIPDELSSVATVTEIVLTCTEPSGTYEPFETKVDGSIPPSFAITLQPGELPTAEWTCRVEGTAEFTGGLAASVPGESVGPFAPVSATIQLEVQ